MKKTIAAVAILLALFLAWSAWPFFALYDLAHAAQTGDVAGVERRVDFPALRRSLLNQIVIAYVRASGQRIDQGLLGVTTTVAAEPLIASLVTPQTLIELMRSGWPKSVLADAPPPDTVAPQLGSPRDILRLYIAADYGIGSFRIALPLDAPPERRFQLRLDLSRWRWKLDTVVLPPALTDRLVRELTRLRERG
jgi:hypothetical protein